MRSKSTITALVVLLLFATTLLLATPSVKTVFAEGEDRTYRRSELDDELSPVDGVNGQKWIRTLNIIMTAGKRVVGPLAAINIVIGALMMMGITPLMSSKNQDTAHDVGKLMIIFSILALVCFYMIPSVINGAIATFKPYAYNPPGFTP